MHAVLARLGRERERRGRSRGERRRDDQRRGEQRHRDTPHVTARAGERCRRLARRREGHPEGHPADHRRRPCRPSAAGIGRAPPAAGIPSARRRTPGGPEGSGRRRFAVRQLGGDPEAKLRALAHQLQPFGETGDRPATGIGVGCCDLSNVTPERSLPSYWISATSESVGLRAGARRQYLVLQPRRGGLDRRIGADPAALRLRP